MLVDTDDIEANKITLVFYNKTKKKLFKWLLIDSYSYKSMDLKYYSSCVVHNWEYNLVTIYKKKGFIYMTFKICFFSCIHLVQTEKMVFVDLLNYIYIFISLVSCLCAYKKSLHWPR